MRRTQQVQNHFDRIESLDRNLHEKGVPVAHRPVPKSGKLERFEFPTLITLLADETGLLVNLGKEIELISPTVPKQADDINRIEMGGVSHSREGFRIIFVDLDTFQDLQ